MQSIEGGLGLGLGLCLVTLGGLPLVPTLIICQPEAAVILSSGNPTEKRNVQASKQSINQDHTTTILDLKALTWSTNINMAATSDLITRRRDNNSASCHRHA